MPLLQHARFTVGVHLGLYHTLLVSHDLQYVLYIGYHFYNLDFGLVARSAHLNLLFRRSVKLFNNNLLPFCEIDIPLRLTCQFFKVLIDNFLPPCCSNLHAILASLSFGQGFKGELLVFCKMQ